jgi:hypothetical protein
VVFPQSVLTRGAYWPVSTCCLLRQQISRSGSRSAACWRCDATNLRHDVRQAVRQSGIRGDHQLGVPQRVSPFWIIGPRSAWDPGVADFQMGSTAGYP